MQLPQSNEKSITGNELIALLILRVTSSSSEYKTVTSTDEHKSNEKWLGSKENSSYYVSQAVTTR